ncbi:NADPH-dependent FMN reductase [Corynebacterium kutscheri]|uniref:LLM-partnered FMN reductase, CE1759 family n=1 Tax=Corynebacterium kutscheri TaxID=35755 RepID=A0A0F6TD51_9CORY|nr:CE1759 family FMN reductase [Corynebacterium kutscheri]AKE41331.1 LLM-partnered FMN reductase, CE1759 family [Corynebacterium kutscheri]VEH08607.1 NADPH-dependent FMN reductase [Corynebacterium kutscheri]VEH09653.1 NADPH-dependent FMN reductase [Corynebacterium kutscheri]VEH79736.1 NADPH-dependent FMN reductase [Corynebacterium kutscheri]
MRTIAIVHAGLSNPSSSRKLGEAIAARVEQHLSTHNEQTTIYLIELKDLGHDLVDMLIDCTTPSKKLQEAIDKVTQADALIAVTPVFQASYSGLFKMFFDVLDPQSLIKVPVIIASNAGSLRHALVLEYAVRPLFAYLRAAIVPTAVLVTPSDKTPEYQSALDSRIDRAASELVSLLIPSDTTLD